ncbi:protein FAM181B-like [Macrobrachium nipponense]|uniref:protein FAM181B-like n=1 Tax=Macrobrachium nipponense TaxID=159736 RepID=UPI0030C8185D
MAFTLDTVLPVYGCGGGGGGGGGGENHRCCGCYYCRLVVIQNRKLPFSSFRDRSRPGVGGVVAPALKVLLPSPAICSASGFVLRGAFLSDFATFCRQILAMRGSYIEMCVLIPGDTRVPFPDPQQEKVIAGRVLVLDLWGYIGLSPSRRFDSRVRRKFDLYVTQPVTSIYPAAATAAADPADMASSLSVLTFEDFLATPSPLPWEGADFILPPPPPPPPLSLSPPHPILSPPPSDFSPTDIF